ncbi:MAG: hypothetical protein VR64_24445 [Desulfatitalea sp. BRH_c12]|nr:MAG: hypothetical protein VR64_24445 [Desulfatitalea sp. BRH_c12]
MRIVTAAEMQSIDRHTIADLGIPGRVLMENAGRGATRSFLERIYASGPGRVGVIAGRGNNGGDGFVMARYLAERKIEVEVFLLARQEQVKGDAAANLHLLTTLHVPIAEIPDAPAFARHRLHMLQSRYWIDAIFGTGLNAEVRGYFKEVIEFINSLGRPVFAVDIPSGVHADNGQPCGICIKANATATFGYAKIGHLIYPGADLCGTIDVIDIGIPAQTIPSGNLPVHMLSGHHVQSLVPRRTIDSHKGRTGHVLVLAASTGKTGAAAMAANAVIRSGGGLVTLGIPQTLLPIVASQVTEAMTVPLPDDGTGMLTPTAENTIARALVDKRVLAIGPGIGTAPATRQLVHHVVRTCKLPLVIDADGLNTLAGHLALLAQRDAATVLTPHPGEMARLLDCSVAAVQQDRLAAARELARLSAACVVLKGARTLICDADGHVWINTTGNPGMASGGMGDVLTGAVAGWLAQGCSPVHAAIVAVFLHGLAADMLAAQNPWGYTATEVMNVLPQALYRVLKEPPASPIHGPVL